MDVNPEPIVEKEPPPKELDEAAWRLLDFSKADDVVMSEGVFDNVNGNLAESSGFTAVDSCNSSVSGGEPQFSGGFADVHVSGELWDPCDDVDGLEWLTNFVEDSFSSQNHLHLISPPNNPPHVATSSSYVATSSSHVPARAHISYPTKARSKRSRIPPSRRSFQPFLVYSRASSSELLAKTIPSKKRDNNEPMGRKCLYCGPAASPTFPERVQKICTTGDRIGISLDDIRTELLGLERPAINLNVVDEDGFPRSNSDTLPSDQALAATVHMNTVFGKEIPALQVPPTAQQKYSDEAFGNDEVEEGEIWAKRTEEGGIAEVQFDSRCNAKRKRKEKTPRGVRGNKKTTGVRIGTLLEDILQTRGISLKDDAKHLKEGFSPLNSDTLPSNQASGVAVDTNSVVGKEIPSLKNSDEDFGNEEGEILAERTEEDRIPEVQFEEGRKEKTPRGKRRNKKTTGKNLKGVKPTQLKRGAKRQRELKVDDTPSSKKQSKSVKGRTSRNTSRGGLAESNFDVNRAGGQTSSKKRSTSVVGKGEIKIKKPRSTEPTNENEGEVLETAFRSSLRGIITLIKELNLRTCHKEVLKRTPFWGIFEAIIENKLSPKQCRKSDKMIIKIINTYDPVAKIFRLGREYMELTQADMVSIFGISCGNKVVDLKYCPKVKVKLVKRREILERRLTSKLMKQLLEKYLGSDEKDDIEDVARLLCLYLFHTFLFPTGPTVKWVYLERIEDLDRLRDYDWNKAIINELMLSIEKYHCEPRKVTGCVMALLYWLCEHTNLSQALHPEHPLGIVKWSIPVVVSRFKKIWLKDLKPCQVVSRQANGAGTADEVPVDKDIVQDSVSSGDVPVSNRGNDACSEAGYQCDKALPSPSNSHDCDNEHTASTDMGIPQLNHDILPSDQAVAVTVAANNVWIKARYVNDIIVKFQLCRPWRMAELEQQVKKRLKLEAETYFIKYKDEVNELILIACDEDLEEYISSSRALGTNPIEVFLDPK